MSGTVSSDYHQTKAGAYLDGVFTGLVVMLFLVLAVEILWHHGMRREAIEAGAARYDAQTGEFQFGCTGGGTR